MESITRFEKDVHYKIDKHANRLDMGGGLVQMAKNLYSDFNSKEVTYTRPDDVFALASLYVAARVQNEPVTPEELTEDTTVDEGHVIKAYKSMVSKLAKEKGLVVEVPDAGKFIEKYGNELGVTETTISKAKEILEDTEEVMQNKASSTKAAASLYSASILTNERVLQKDISRVSGVSGASIRNRYKEQLDAIGALTDSKSLS